MTKTILSDKAPQPIGPYSQAIVAEGKFLFISGQLGLMPDGNFAGDDAETQTLQVLKNIEAVLNAAGCTPKDVVKTTLLLKNMNDFALVNEIYGRYFGESKPARATMEVCRLPKDGLVCIDAIALVNE